MSVGYQDNFKIGSPKPADTRFGYDDLTTGNYRLFADTAEAYASIPTSFRYQGLTVGINNSGKTEEWWFRDNINTLVKKTSGAGGDVENGLSINTGNDKIRLGGTLNQVTTIATSSTNTLSITGLDTSTTNAFSITLDANGRLYKSNYVSAILADNGLTKTGNTVILGGTLNQNTTVNLATKVLTFSATAANDNPSKLEVNKTLRRVSSATSDITGVKLKSTFDLNGTSSIDFNTDCKINTSNYSLLEFSNTDNGVIDGPDNQALFSASHNELILGGTSAAQNKVNGNVSALSTRVVFKQSGSVDTLAAHRIMSPIISGTYTGATAVTIGLQIDSQRFHLNTTQVDTQYAIVQSGNLDLNQFQGRTSFTNNVAIGLSATSITDINNGDTSINNIPLTVIKGVSDLTVAPLMASANSILVINNVTAANNKPGLVSSFLGQLNYSSSTARDLTGRSNFSGTAGYFAFNSNTATLGGEYISGLYGQGLFAGKDLTFTGVSSSVSSGVVTLQFGLTANLSSLTTGDLVRVAAGSPGSGDFNHVDVQVSTVNNTNKTVVVKKYDNTTNVTLSAALVNRTVIITLQAGSLDTFVAIKAAPPVASRYLGFKGTLTTAIGLQIEDQRIGVGASYTAATERPTGTLTNSYAIKQIGLNDIVSLASNKINFLNLPTYANDAAAGSGGLTTGYLYKTSTGEVRVKL